MVLGQLNKFAEKHYFLLTLNKVLLDQTLKLKKKKYESYRRQYNIKELYLLEQKTFLNATQSPRDIHIREINQIS